MLIKKILLLSTLIIYACISNAQTTDNFTDGNFTINPVWTGDDSLFNVNSSLQLQSKGTAGTSRDISLVTPSVQRFNCEWSCWLRFALNPSSQNFCRYYLCSDQADLKAALNGFYVQLGGSTGNTDSISLYKQSGLNRTRLIGGRAGTVAKTNNVLQLKITCDSVGNWQLFSDTSNFNNYALEGSGMDNTNITSVYTGYYVKYTSGNISNYFFDDVYAGAQRFDKIAPAVSGVEIASSNSLLIEFTERMNNTNLFTLQNYTLDNVLNPTRIINNSKANTIELIFSDTFKTGSLHRLQTTALSDVAGNLLSDTLLYFNYYILQKNDLLISEFMPDPDPSQTLPNAEYVELYNNSDYSVQLNNIKLKDATAYVVLPSFILAPHSFVIVCEKANEILFTKYGKVITVGTMPSLNNTGDELSLTDVGGKTIFKLNYNLNWYGQVNKQNGGWSLEMINPNNLCAGASNWHACEDARGGTPGTRNSIWKFDEDTLPPLLKSVIADSANTITLLFNEPLDSALSSPLCRVTLNGELQTHQPFFGSAQTNLPQVTLNSTLHHAETYQLQVTHAFDCKGNELDQSTQFTYMAVSEPAQNELLINEIMFAPSTQTLMPNAEFIELYNAGKYAVNLKDYTLSDGTSTAKFPAVILYPDSYLLVCGTTALPLLLEFGQAVGLTNFPSLNIDDRLTLYNNRAYVIHQVSYKESFLNNALKQQTGGWTIEMKDNKNPCGNVNNWSACIDPKGGTPGKINSIRQSNKDIKPPTLLRAYPIDSNHLRLYFSETIDSMSTANLTGISITNSLHPFQYNYAGTNLNEVEYSFEKPFDTLSILNVFVDSIKDCAGNYIDENTQAEFGIAHKPDSGDIVINEVLFNPVLNGNDFVELYNKTNKFLSLNTLMIARYNEQHQPEQAISLGTKGYLLAPYSYLVVTYESEKLPSFFNVPFSERLMDAKLPDLNDDAGSVILLDQDGIVFDQLIYTDKMHFELLTNKEGVSLERIDPNRSSADASNWTSASGNSGYATPTYRNSQYTVVTQKGSFIIEPEVFSPDGDGYKDILTFSYDLASNSNVGKIEIYNSTGSLIKKVCSNYYIGSSGQISWNGITDDGQKAGIGIYIANFEIFNLKGETQQFQKTFVVSAR